MNEIETINGKTIPVDGPVGAYAVYPGYTLNAPIVCSTPKKAAKALKTEVVAMKGALGAESLTADVKDHIRDRLARVSIYKIVETAKVRMDREIEKARRAMRKAADEGDLKTVSKLNHQINVGLEIQAERSQAQ